MIDLRSGDLRELYAANATRCTIVEVPPLSVLAIDGVGDPAVSTEYRVAVESLMALAWGVRATVKAEDSEAAFKVMPLEGDWTLPDTLMFAEDPAIRAQLRWTLQVVQPAVVDAGVVARSRDALRRKGRDPGALDRVELRVMPGGSAGQLLHRGPYRDEPATIARLHCCIRQHGGHPRFGHREIYLNDPRRTPPEKLKTILRVAFTRQ